MVTTMPGHDIEITMTGRMASVKIDGREHHNAVTAYTIEHVAGERPTIVTLSIIEATLFEAGAWHDIAADVRLSDATTELLIALGWTPPHKYRDTTLMDGTA